MRTQEEIDEQVNLAADQIAEGHSRWRGATYEEGVENALLWVTGASDDKPMED